ncbi:hypothetical protein KOW79_002085 [Hemibagrus wyckioides]|uniref:Uncharacterized protein n=1 Tax=Hemibagrus wyckioides TaxID=337641 RepID=A0A9D3SWF7_9TELE|nr:hypothetical protein KOW79_002085 [Hemibagrus wyckioides]
MGQKHQPGRNTPDVTSSGSSLPEVTPVFLTPVKRIRWRRTRRPHHVTHQMLRQRDEEPRVESYREPQISRLFRNGAPGERGTGASELTHSSLLDTQIISDPDSYVELEIVKHITSTSQPPSAKAARRNQQFYSEKGKF